jgi:hypothetical protein
MTYVDARVVDRDLAVGHVLIVEDEDTRPRVHLHGDHAPARQFQGGEHGDRALVAADLDRDDDARVGT